MAKEEIKNRDKIKILFFDDQAFTIRSLTLNLELIGWDVKYVSEIDELFQELYQNQYDILILDIVAPIPDRETCKYIHFTESEIDEMDDGMLTGVVVAKKIWSIEKYKEIPVLFHSARSNPIPNDKVLQNSKCYFMRKPEFAKNVDQKLHEMLNS